ncbi:YphA family membrane protein [Bacillus sp. Marseille-P3800]|uniref:YphA family membrane protein n=1 Tax=Bacillus sp. Marseille-P3800 TaxID=2014782 RepID=UPI000C078AC8|nr:hypothetical protein [Bacillus sp. Marseille-P3800]
MEGFYFYWLGWMFWGIVTFFMPKTAPRAIFSVILLTVLIFAPLNWTFGPYTVSFGLFFFLICCYAVIGRLPIAQLAYSIFVSILIATVHVSTQAFIQMDPIILSVGPFLVQVVPSFILAVLLIRRPIRTVVLGIGMIHGEILNQIRQASEWPVSIGSFAFWDLLALACALSIGVSAMMYSIQWVEKRTIERYFRPKPFGNRIDKHA